jgi:predicted GNAT family N-acyltransferase
MQVEVIRVETIEQMNQALWVRRSVFIEEQNVPESLEIDEHDEDPTLGTSAVHVLACLDRQPVATGRLLLDEHGEHVHIGRVAVLASQRRRGIGRTVMLALQDLARRRGASSVTLAAQLHAIGFYERLGYTVRGDVFLDAGIEHRWMDLDLQAEP